MHGPEGPEEHGPNLKKLEKLDKSKDVESDPTLSVVFSAWFRLVRLRPFKHAPHPSAGGWDFTGART